MDSPHKGSVTLSFAFSFDVGLNKALNKPKCQISNWNCRNGGSYLSCATCYLATRQQTYWWCVSEVLTEPITLYDMQPFIVSMPAPISARGIIFSVCPSVLSSLHPCKHYLNDPLHSWLSVRPSREISWHLFKRMGGMSRHLPYWPSSEQIFWPSSVDFPLFSTTWTSINWSSCNLTIFRINKIFVTLCRISSFWPNFHLAKLIKFHVSGHFVGKHERNGLKVGVLMYPDPLQKCSDLSHGLLIFLISAQLWLSKTGHNWCSQSIYSECMELYV